VLLEQEGSVTTTAYTDTLESVQQNKELDIECGIHDSQGDGIWLVRAMGVRRKLLVMHGAFGVE
jgi:hypothetical protein